MPDNCAQLDIQHEQPKDWYCLQAPSTDGLPGSTFNLDRNGFLARDAPIGGAKFKNMFLRFLYRTFYATGTSQTWWDTCAKDICTNLSGE